MFIVMFKTKKLESSRLLYAQMFDNIQLALNFKGDLQIKGKYENDEVLWVCMKEGIK